MTTVQDVREMMLGQVQKMRDFVKKRQKLYEGQVESYKQDLRDTPWYNPLNKVTRDTAHERIAASQHIVDQASIALPRLDKIEQAIHDLLPEGENTLDPDTTEKLKRQLQLTKNTRAWVDKNPNFSHIDEALDDHIKYLDRVATELNLEKGGPENEAELQAVAIDIKEIIDLPAEQQLEEVVNSLLAAAGIPASSEFTISEKFRNITNSRAAMLLEEMGRYLKTPDMNKREAILGSMLEKTTVYSGQILRQFIQDNTDETTLDRFDTARFERQHDPLQTEMLGGQLSVIKELSAGNEEGAMKNAKVYVREKLLGLKTTDTVSEKTEKMITMMAQNFYDLATQAVYPKIAELISDFNTKGFFESVHDSALKKAGFIADLITSPMDQYSRDDIAQSFTPIIYYGGEGKLDDLVPIVQDAAQVFANVTLNKGQALELAKTIAGMIAASLPTIAITLSTGSSISAAEKSGAITKTTATALRAGQAAVTGLKKTTKAVRKLGKRGRSLTLTDINQRISGKADEILG